MRNGTEKTLLKISQTIRHYLALEIQGRRFKGKITIELNCNDGGIGNTSIYAEHHIKNKKVDFSKKNDYTNNE